MMWTTAWEPTTTETSATDPERSTSEDAPTSQQGTATAAPLGDSGILATSPDHAKAPSTVTEESTGGSSFADAGREGVHLVFHPEVNAPPILGEGDTRFEVVEHRQVTIQTFALEREGLGGLDIFGLEGDIGLGNGCSGERAQSLKADLVPNGFETAHQIPDPLRVAGGHRGLSLRPKVDEVFEVATGCGQRNRRGRNDGDRRRRRRGLAGGLCSSGQGDQAEPQNHP